MKVSYLLLFRNLIFNGQIEKKHFSFLFKTYWSQKLEFPAPLAQKGLYA